MRVTHQLLSHILKCNPHITHLHIRCYKHARGNPLDPRASVLYRYISRRNVRDIRNIITTYEQRGWTVGLTSRVKTKHGMRYLLMLDYAIAPSRRARNELQLKLETFNKSGDVPYSLSGFLIQTKNSYHYLGLYATSQKNLINFLGSALLFRHSDQTQFVVDDRWIGHSIKRRFGVIRLGQKDGVYPRMIARIH